MFWILLFFQFGFVDFGMTQLLSTMRLNISPLYDPTYFHYATQHISTMRPNISPLCDPQAFSSQTACLRRFADIRKTRSWIFRPCYCFEIALILCVLSSLSHQTRFGRLWGTLGSLWVPFGTSLFTVCDACRQNQASWNTPPDAREPREPRKWCQELQLRALHTRRGPG